MEKGHDALAPLRTMEAIASPDDLLADEVVDASDPANAAIVHPAASPGMELVSVSHGDAELVLGWWGWYGGTRHVAAVLEEAADRAIANPQRNRFTFEYDGVTFEFYDKFYPAVTAKIRKAAALGAWEVVGGTYSIQLPYQVGIESNIRQWIWGTRTIREIVGRPVKTFHYQEFMLFPQLPMILAGVGIEQTVYENHLAICGRMHKDFRGLKWWQASDGSRVKAFADLHNLFVDWPDLLHIKPSACTLSEYLDKTDMPADGAFRASEKDYYFDAAGYTDSYANLASVKNCVTENLLLTSERVAALAMILGGADYSEQLQAAWRALLGTQTHGVMYCGSESYGSEIGCSDWEGAKFMRVTAERLAGDVLDKSLLYLARRADTRLTRPGCPLFTFNPLAFPHTTIVNTHLTFERAKARSVSLWHGQQEVPCQMEDVARHNDGSLKSLRLIFMAEKLPAMGYRVYQLEYRPSQRIEPIPSSLVVSREANTFENQFIRVHLERNGRIAAVYSKSHGKLLLGSLQDTEPATAYDKTQAIQFRSSLEYAGYFHPKGWEVVEHNALRVTVRCVFETALAHFRLYLTLYEGQERLDLRTELAAKNPEGEVLGISPGEKVEKLWLDFLPAFKGTTKCDTVAAVLDEPRPYYFSNTWVNFAGEDRAFTIIHKGIHAWSEGFFSQLNREKRERGLSAHLGQTSVGWIAGMLRMNTGFADDGAIRHEFSLRPSAASDEYPINKAVQGFYFEPLVRIADSHPGEATERAYIHISSDNALLSAFYADLTTGKQPAMRLWNPSGLPVEAEVTVGFGATKARSLRLDGLEMGSEMSWPAKVPIPPSALRTIAFTHLPAPSCAPVETGLIHSTLACTNDGESFRIEAPLEAYRLYTHYAEYRDPSGVVHMYTDPYDELPLSLTEGARDGDYRTWEGSITVPSDWQGRDVRLVLAWTTSRQYGIGTCMLTNDYAQRADEPVEVLVNGRVVPGYDFNLTRYLTPGAVNHIRLRVLAPEVPESILRQRSSLVEYHILEWASPFERLGSAKLRAGYLITSSNYASLSDAALCNPDFENGDLSGWTPLGQVEMTHAMDNQGLGYQAKLAGQSAIKQTVRLKPGHYILKVKARVVHGKARIGVQTPKGRETSALIGDSGRWESHQVLFSVPDGDSQVVIFGRFQSKHPAGCVCFDDFKIIANKVAKEFPSSAE